MRWNMALRLLCCALLGYLVLVVPAGAIDAQRRLGVDIAMALKAGAMGLPFMPARTALGSDLFSR